MKIATRMFLGSALSVVLLNPSAVLAADQGGDTHSRAATTQRPGPIELRTPSSPPGAPMRLEDGQLDAIKGGQFAIDLLGLGAAELDPLGALGLLGG